MSARLNACVTTCAMLLWAESAAAGDLPLQATAADRRPQVEAFVGLEYATLGRQYESFHIRGIARQPYSLKVADVRFKNLRGLEVGLDAAATSLLAMGGFSKPEQQSQPRSDAERYAALLGYGLGGWVKLSVQGQ